MEKYIARKSSLAPLTRVTCDKSECKVTRTNLLGQVANVGEQLACWVAIQEGGPEEDLEVDLEADLGELAWVVEPQSLTGVS